MNKLFLGLAITAGSLSFAQETAVATPAPMNKQKQPIRFGIKAGGNASAFSEQKLSLNNQKLGFHAGAFVNIPLSEKISVQPEVLYNQMGARNVISSTELTIDNTTIKGMSDEKAYLNYISVPLMFQFRPMKSFYFEAGPEFSYFIDGKNKGTTTVTTTTGNVITTTNQSYSESIDKDNIHKFNFGLGLGIGADITNHIGISARYVNSLTYIAKNTPEGVNPNTNRVFQLGLNYKF
ncbi:PorT family protein [Chryseobacterium nematophagum]|uniref:PorT family protein n=1 Tax=Chryseobacterium nematophagum TaxID=2305228 RepID=A0A3M7TFW2_9FLAO|nr:porin family protein [Chryseobacterium nematophagum]RNA62401.1 PorT family protein [Chryseobacterium nematophagum]